MKKTFKKALSVVLALVMLLGVMQCAFVSFAEEPAEGETPELQTLLTDGKLLKTYLETNYLSLEKADAAVVENLEDYAVSLSSMLTDFFKLIGYSEENYPSDLEGLENCFSRVLSVLRPTVFTDVDAIESMDIELLLNLASQDGGAYINSLNAVLPEGAKITPLTYTQEQLDALNAYKSQADTGAVKLDGFNLSDYLGGLTPDEMLREILLVIIADSDRLPAIIKTAVGVDVSVAQQQTVASAVSEIITNLRTAPVSTLLKQFSKAEFIEVVNYAAEIAIEHVNDTTSYVYTVFNEGVYTDESGNALNGIVANSDGTYSYRYSVVLPEYKAVADAALALLNGIYEELDSSVIETVLVSRMDKIEALLQSAVNALAAFVKNQKGYLQDEIDAANAEIAFAQKKIADIDNGGDKQAEIEELSASLKTLQDSISAKQTELDGLNATVNDKKDEYSAYYAVVNDPSKEGTDEYSAAQVKVNEIEQELAPTYARIKELESDIESLGSQADKIAAELDALEKYDAQAEKETWNEVIARAQKVVSTNTAMLEKINAASDEEYNNVKLILNNLVTKFIESFDGIYTTALKRNPIRAAEKFVYALQGFVNAIDDIDWESISNVTDPLFTQLDELINSGAGKYIGKGGGANIIADASAALNALLEQYGILNFVKVESLNTFINETILADNSEIMQAAASALSAMFPDIQPNYESIISCLVPILSAFNFSEIMANMENISASLSLASPTGFAYLAGIESELLTEGYLDSINASLRANGYTGSDVKAIITLDANKTEELLSYVQMEKNGSSLADIAAAGFNWKDFTGQANVLDIANAFIKIALGDKNKLGSLTEAEGVGPALVNMLCDLFNDLRTDPVNTILKKLSDSKGIAAIVDFAMGLLNGPDSSYKSYDMFFTDKIYFDKDGNTTFYDKLDAEGNPAYTGPDAMGQYLPIAAAALDLFSGIYDDVTANEGDLLKTLLIDKLPQIQNLVKSAISYKDGEGNAKPGVVAYLLMGYADYLKASNAELCYELLIGLQNKAIDEANAKIAEADDQIAIWNQYLSQIEPASNAAKLAKAKELGIVDDSVSEYSEEAVAAAIETKIAELGAKLEQDNASLQTLNAELEPLAAEAEAKRAAADSAVEYVENTLYDDPFLSDLQAVLDAQDESLIDNLRADCEADFNANLGEGAFDEFVTAIIDNMADYDDAEAMVDDILLDVGYGLADTLDGAASSAEEVAAQKQSEIDALTATIDSETAELAELESGAVLEQINTAGNTATVHISDTRINAEGDFSSSDIADVINTINTEDKGAAEATVNEARDKIAEYAEQKEAQAALVDKFNPQLFSSLGNAAEEISTALGRLINGITEDGSDNIYYYIMNKDIPSILTTGGRIQALFETVMSLYDTGVEYLVSQNWISRETADQLITVKPDFTDLYNNTLSTFAEDFNEDPVPELAKIINETCDAALAADEKVSDKTNDMAQVQAITTDIRNIFDDNFGADWNNSYSKTAINRVGEIYQLLLDILGLDIVTDLIEGVRLDEAVISGKIDNSNVYGDIKVTLYLNGAKYAHTTISKTDSGEFVFKDLPFGDCTYSLGISAHSSTETVITDIVFDEAGRLALTDSEKAAISNIKLSIGDVDGSGTVDVSDVSTIILGENYGKSAYHSDSARACDVNGDNSVGVDDISIVLLSENYGGSSVTESVA